MELSKGENRWASENRRFSWEALILYFVLFFPGVYASGFSGEIDVADTINFSLAGELGRTLTYTLPSLALLWYLILGVNQTEKKSFSSLGLYPAKKKDFLAFAAAFPGLVFVGLGISFLAPLFSQAESLAPPPKIEAPETVWGWIVIAFSCLGTGYLEESYFRYYLFAASPVPSPEKLRLDSVTKVLLSAFLFSLCHIYEGPWGILNAALAGILLSALFVRFGSLHGIAWAHGAYNVFVYFIMGNFST